MFRHILVPLDLGRHERTLRTARTLARQNGARVTLLHVIQHIEDIPPVELRRFYARLTAKVRVRLEAAARRFRTERIPTRVAIVVSDPPLEIVRHAARNAVDLIVLGSHKIRPGRTLRRFGTTSYKVGLLCQCPVLLVK